MATKQQQPVMSGDGGGIFPSLLDIPFPLCFELQFAPLKEFPRLMSSFQNHAGFLLPGDKAKEGSMPYNGQCSVLHESRII